MAFPGETTSGEDFGLGADFDKALAQAAGEGDSGTGNPDDSPKVTAAAGFGASSAEAGPMVSGGEHRVARGDMNKLKMILDVPMKVHVELGRTKMLINDLLQLGQGSVIELDKLAGEPMEILLNDKLIALGEVVVVNEKFGVRLTDVISQFGLGDFAQK